VQQEVPLVAPERQPSHPVQQQGAGQHHRAAGKDGRRLLRESPRHRVYFRDGTRRARCSNSRRADQRVFRP
jgi:hypothetical protein